MRGRKPRRSVRYYYESVTEPGLVHPSQLYSDRHIEARVVIKKSEHRNSVHHFAQTSPESVLRGHCEGKSEVQAYAAVLKWPLQNVFIVGNVQLLRPPAIPDMPDDDTPSQHYLSVLIRLYVSCEKEKHTIFPGRRRATAFFAPARESRRLSAVTQAAAVTGREARGRPPNAVPREKHRREISKSQWQRKSHDSMTCRNLCIASSGS
ncbi:hypothetical protein EVAR_25146_1 [Eumeta japonica]|uniref:Uncharacterized protein n=1 Tax=Eumeta variegata TaxID=151549 RepID=A0A4C1VQA1_EUMVA|nr:hypothetical protein EVAR_25146_1 [Eumeta japonica]